MTLTFEILLDNITMNQHVKYFGGKLSSSKVIVGTHTDKHTRQISLPGPLK